MIHGRRNQRKSIHGRRSRQGDRARREAREVDEQVRIRPMLERSAGGTDLATVSKTSERREIRKEDPHRFIKTSSEPSFSAALNQFFSSSKASSNAIAMPSIA